MFDGSRGDTCLGEVHVGGTIRENRDLAIYVYPGEVTAVQLTFGTGCKSAQGTAVWRNKPVSFAFVVFMRESHTWGRWSPLVVVTNIRGQWTLKGLPPGIYRVGAVPFLHNRQLRYDVKLLSEIESRGIRLDLRKIEKVSDLEVPLLLEN
jgi:hypothetical protein